MGKKTTKPSLSLLSILATLRKIRKLLRKTHSESTELDYDRDFEGFHFKLSNPDVTLTAIRFSHINKFSQCFLGARGQTNVFVIIIEIARSNQCVVT